MSHYLARNVVLGITALISTACAASGSIRQLQTPGQPPLDVFGEGSESEEVDKAIAVVPVWMLDGSRPADAALWGAYARAVVPAVQKDPEGLPLADEAARSAMARAVESGAKLDSKYLCSDLPLIEGAGFMQEHSRLELEGGGAALEVRPDRLVAYVRWRADTLPDMVPESAVAVRSGRRKLSRKKVPWPSIVAGMTTYLKFAIDRKDCAAIENVASIMVPAWELAKKGATPFSMDADQRHLDYLKKNVKESQNVVMYATGYRDSMIASAGCARRSGKNDVALARATLGNEMDPLCSACFSERAAAHLALGDRTAAQTEAKQAQELAKTPGEQQLANEIYDLVR